MKLVYEEKRVKEFRVTGNLDNANTRIIMDNITPPIEMGTKVIYSLNQGFIEVLIKSWITARYLFHHQVCLQV